MANIAGAGTNADQITHWNGEVGRKWAQHQDSTDFMLAGLTEKLLRRADVCSGEQIIDLGCGCGTTTFLLARKTGPKGKVTGIDISEPMLARARAYAPGETGALSATVDFVLADATTYAFPQDSADLIFSRFGVMFFNEPERAFCNLARAIKTGSGRMVFMCWRTMQENPWVTLPVSVALRHMPAPPISNPEAPGPFAFGNAERIKLILRQSGFTLVSMEQAEDDMPIGGPYTGKGCVAEAVDFASRIGPLAQFLREAPSDSIRDKIRSDMYEELKAYDSPKGPRLKGRVWIVTAKAE